MLEDARNGVLAGKAAGCLVIAVPNDYTRGQDFSAADWVEPDLFAAAQRIESCWLRLFPRLNGSQPFSRVEMSPISSPHSWAR